MSADLHDSLTAAAPRAGEAPDIAALWARGRRQCRARLVGGILVVVCALFLGGFAVAALRSSGSNTVATVSPKGTLFINTAKRFQVTIPPGWNRATEVLTPYVVDPAELLSAATFPIACNCSYLADSSLR